MMRVAGSKAKLESPKASWIASTSHFVCHCLYLFHVFCQVFVVCLTFFLYVFCISQTVNHFYSILFASPEAGVVFFSSILVSPAYPVTLSRAETNDKANDEHAK